MAIKSISPQVLAGSFTTHGVAEEVLYAGRVVAIKKVDQLRNHSDTLDYTDFRTVECTYALVYLGTECVPPRATMQRGPHWDSDSTPCLVAEDLPYASWHRPRALEAHEMFAWVDCTNIFVWRGSPHLTPEVDVDWNDPNTYEPEMKEHFAMWEKATAEREEKRLADIRAAQQAAARERAEKEAKKAAREAKKQAKVQAETVVAQAELGKAPKKGEEVKVGDFMGRVFWTGVTTHKGKTSARLGVKNARGEVVWCDAAQAVKQ